jgi:nucleotide-binding universal stress UspA family protein
MYQRILAAIDDSTTSKLALKEAAQLAKAHNATLRMVHVIDDTFAYTAVQSPREMVDRQAALRRAGEDALNDAAATARALGVNAETALLTVVEASDRVYDAIEQEAERWPADLVVIGTHGRRGFRRLLLGSVAEGLIRVTTKPVLLVRGGE